MKIGISICISKEIEFNEEKMKDKLLLDLFPKVSKAIDEENFIIDNIETFDV